MTPQPDISPNANALATEQQIIQKRMMGAIRYAVETDGVEKARAFFDTINAYCSYWDEWPSIARQARNLFAMLDSMPGLATPPEDDADGVPGVLCTAQATELLKRAREAKLLDDRLQPLVSRTKAALLADALAERLDIKDKWKVFETLWHCKNMRSYFNEALSQMQSLEFRDKLKKVLAV